MKRAAQLAVFVLCLAFTVGAIVNVFSDNAEVEKLAGRVACDATTTPAATATARPGAKPASAGATPGECAMTMTRMSRSPIGQSFEFTGRSATRRVRCTRGFIMFGDYTCVGE